jgi:dihydropteroate synthase
LAAPPNNTDRLKPAVLRCGGKSIVLDRPRIMGILNTTPDSFSDGGQWSDIDRALHHALDMVSEGADIIDIGGESTRPGAQAVPVEEELERVIRLIERLSGEIDIPISVDTSKPEVMREAVSAGAGMINDVYALRQEGAIEAAAQLGVPVCLMHMQGEPRTMQSHPQYSDVVGEVAAFLSSRARVCMDAGIPADQIVVDPGFGFGKSMAHNLALLEGLPALAELGYPVLAGLSRKSMLGAITGREAGKRTSASVAAALLAVQNGAAIVRVHDVAETADALKVLAALRGDPY